MSPVVLRRHSIRGTARLRQSPSGFSPPQHAASICRHVVRRPLSMQPSPTLASTWTSVAPPSHVGAFCSRRAWQRVYQRPQPNAAQTSKKDSLDDKPWPRSVRITGYVVGATAIPYCLAWLVASNDATRRFVFPRAPPAFEEALRYLFGTPEIDYVSYVDTTQDHVPVPKQLDQELPYKIRQEQAHIDALANEWTVPARIRVVTHGGFHLSQIVQLPGSTLAKTETLLQEAMKDREQALELQDVAFVTVDFADIKEEQEETNTKMVDINVLYKDQTDLPEQQSSNTDSSSHVSQLAKQTNIYSVWHYQPNMPAPSQQQSSSSKQQKHDMEVSRLEYEIHLLDRQLKDPNTTRSFDDVQEELSAKRKELSRLNGWRRWLRV